MSDSLVDENGIIRYDWPEIRLLFVGGSTVADIARSLTVDCPDSYDTVSNTIYTRARRDEWAETSRQVAKLAESRPRASVNGSSELSTTVQTMAQNIAIERKKSYIDRTSGFIDKASKLLEDRPLQTLEDAAMAGKLFDPVHQIAKDIHGLNAREPVAALQVNILSELGSATIQQDE